MSKPVIAGIIFLLVAIGAIVFFSMSGNDLRAEVCMEFAGRTACKTVSGDTKEHVVQRAVSGACADIAGGVTDTINCEHQAPKSVTWK